MAVTVLPGPVGRSPLPARRRPEGLLAVTEKPEFEVAAGPGLRLSFQRYRCPESGLVDRFAPSCGALPVLVASPDLLVPCPRGEALWIGLLPVRPTGAAGTVLVRALGSVQVVEVPPAYGIMGAPRTDVPEAIPCWALARASNSPPCLRIELAVTFGDTRTAVGVELIDPDRYAALAGRRLPPLDEAAAYDGRRLP